MFRWYKDAWVCLAYLSDMTGSKLSFQQSRWFTRGWTLQELIAPKSLVFFDREWKFAGTKETEASDISMITGIPKAILYQTVELADVPVAQRFSWASTRQTTREEDQAYSLLGLFDINMPMLYGEGAKAFLRLQEQIVSQSADMSIFMWTDLQTMQDFTGIFATSPACFLEMRDVRAQYTFVPHDFYSTNRGIRLKLRVEWDEHTGLAVLPLRHFNGAGEPSDEAEGEYHRPVGIFLRQLGTDLFVRAQPDVCPPLKSEDNDPLTITVVKSLSEMQSQWITNNVIKVLIPAELSVRVEPHGSWNPQTQFLYAGHARAFTGYMRFWKSVNLDFAIVFSFRGGKWSAETREGTDVSTLAQSYEQEYDATFDGLRFSASLKYARMAYIPDIDGTAVTVHMRGGDIAELPCIEIRIVEGRDGETSIAMR